MLTFATPFFYIGLGSGMNKYSDPDPGSGIKHPGSATLPYWHLMLDPLPRVCPKNQSKKTFLQRHYRYRYLRSRKSQINTESANTN
jgi:hypothetical protein